jgi:hypothetical protein
LLGHSLKSQKDFKAKQGFYLHLFIKQKPKGKFVVSPTIELVGFYSFKNEKSHPSIHDERS